MDCAELRAAIARAGVPKKSVASHLGISGQALYNKVTGRSEFKNSEIKKLAQMLDLSPEEVNIIFFGK